MPAVDNRTERRWQEAVEEHRVALAAFLDAAQGLSDDAWARSWGPGKWTRAQVAEHLALVYEVVMREVATGEGMKMRATGWRQKVTRWIVLPHILFHRSIPLRPPSPRELRPGEPRAPQGELLRQLRQLGERFEHEMDRAFRAGGGAITHPYFGSVDAVRAMRFVAIHMEHHLRQIANGK